jgi:hypothetical protein
MPVPAAAAPLPGRTTERTALVAAPLVAEGWSWRKLYRPFENALGSRRRMVQFGVVGMCIALYIMMRK